MSWPGLSNLFSGRLTFIAADQQGLCPGPASAKENTDGLVSSYIYLAFLHPGVGQTHPQCGRSAASTFNLMPLTSTIYPSRKPICFALGEKREIKSPNK